MKPIRMKLIRVRARDRRMAAIHEAGHLVIARMFGFPGSAWIWPNDQPEEKTWLGRTKRCPIISVNHGKVRVKTPTKSQDRMIAVAGAVAEACWQDRAIWRVAVEWDWDDPVVMSDSDWHLSGCPIGRPSPALYTAIDKVEALLRSDCGALWPSLCQTARDLIIENRAIEYVDSCDEAAA
jgi:hypothetical protein